MKLWKIQIEAARYHRGTIRLYTYTGTATSIEIALRKMARTAKKEGLCKIEVRSVEYLGEKEF